MNPFLAALQQPNQMQQFQMPQGFPAQQGAPQFQMPQGMQGAQMQPPALDPYGQQNTGLRQALMRGFYG